jgi:hypothetical protein
MNELILPQPVSSLCALNEWLFNAIKPYLNGRVLEIGSSPSSISVLFVQKGRRIHLSNSDRSIREELKVIYQGLEIVRNVHAINIHHPNFEQVYPSENARIFDTVLILNGMQDGLYDQKVICNGRHLLRERGRLILLMPVFTALYDTLEFNLEDFKKYDQSSIRKLLTDQMEILINTYFNLVQDPAYDRSGQSVLVIAQKK